MPDEITATDPLDGVAAFDESALDYKLEPKEDLFVEEYLVDFVASEAAKRAGFGASSGFSLLQRPGIAAKIRIGLAQKLRRVKVRQDDVLYRTSLLANSSIHWFVVNEAGNVIPTPEAPARAIEVIQSVKRHITTRTDPKTNEVIQTVQVEIKLWDKLAPLRLLGKHVGLFADKVEVTGPNGGPIETVSRIERVIVDPVTERRLPG